MIQETTQPLRVDEIMSSLVYSSYAANRGYGLTHEQLVNIGIGNDAMRLKYENEIKTIKSILTL